MSEGVERAGPRTDAEYWSQRWHWIADALVVSGLCPDVDGAQYEKVKQELWNSGVPLSLAAFYAFSACKQTKVPSACEVNPW